MRLKTFSAPTTREAMRLVREALGPDAIIVSSQTPDKGKGVRITAAIEDTPETRGAPAPMSSEDTVEYLADVLAQHGVPGSVSERVLTAAGRVQTRTIEPAMSLAVGLDATFGFAPLDQPRSALRGGRPVILVGPPGVGKTVTTAKLAARLVLAGQKAVVITTDTARAGAVEQLAAFTRVLQLDLVQAGDGEMLAKLARAAEGAPVLIDSAGVNPFDARELVALDTLVRAAAAEPVLLIAAGGDPQECAEIGEAFAGIGATRLVVTRVDAARRLGGLMAAASAGNLAFAEVSNTPHVAEGLSPLNPIALARLLLPAAADAQAHTHPKQAVAS